MIYLLQLNQSPLLYIYAIKPPSEQSGTQMSLAGINKFKRKRVFVNPSQISKHLLCCICQDVFEDPVRLQCGHTFCYVCIQYWALFKQHCPMCKSSFGYRKAEKDLLAIALVDDLEVKCVHLNCSWQGVEAVRSKHQRCCTFKPKNEKIPQPDKVKFVEVTDFDSTDDNEVQIIDENYP